MTGIRAQYRPRQPHANLTPTARQAESVLSMREFRVFVQLSVPAILSYFGGWFIFELQARSCGVAVVGGCLWTSNAFACPHAPEFVCMRMHCTQRHDSPSAHFGNIIHQILALSYIRNIGQVRNARKHSLALIISRPVFTAMAGPFVCIWDCRKLFCALDRS